MKKNINLTYSWRFLAPLIAPLLRLLQPHQHYERKWNFLCGARHVKWNLKQSKSWQFFLLKVTWNRHKQLHVIWYDASFPPQAHVKSFCLILLIFKVVDTLIVTIWQTFEYGSILGMLVFFPWVFPWCSSLQFNSIIFIQHQIKASKLDPTLMHYFLFTHFPPHSLCVYTLLCIWLLVNIHVWLSSSPHPSPSLGLVEGSSC